MPPFPWDSLKAETLRSICKDIGVNLGTKRKREQMVTLLKEVEIRGLPSSTSQDCASVTTRLPNSHDQREDSGGEDEDAESGDHRPVSNIESHPVSDTEPTCPCADGWLSPRMKFILRTVAAVASDLVRDTGELAIEFGHVGGVYMTQHFPHEELPRGKKAAAQWVEGLSTIYGVIDKVFKAGHIPTEPVLLEALEKLPKAERTMVGAYARHTEIEYALSALVQQAKEDWEDEFQEIHCNDSKKWHKLPKCVEHDLNWTTVEDILVG